LGDHPVRLARAISGRSRSLATRLFFIAQPKPVEEPADRGAMNHHTTSCQLDAQIVQRDIAIVGNTRGDPWAMRDQFTATWRMTLPGWRDRALRPPQDHHVVDEPRRNPEMPSRFTMAVAFLDKRNDTRTQLYRMRLAHGRSPSMSKVNHKSVSNGILNHVSRDTL
jgi:hypothetical protein